MKFFEQLLPEYGLICIARALPTSGFAHRFFDNITDAVEFMKIMDAQGHTMYLAQSSFSDIALQNQYHNSTLPRNLTPEERKAQRRGERTHANVHMVRSFWFDIDSGEGKPYVDQIASLKALRLFCQQTGLPYPTIVNSGNGLYAHWFLDRDITGAIWTATAQIFKGVAKAFDFHADDSRTSDSASVLRPPGSHNRKRGACKEVKVCGELTEPIDFDGFSHQLMRLALEKKVSTSPMAPPKQMDPNAQFLQGIGGPSSSAHIIAEKCNQIRHIRDTQGHVDEPFWYAAIGVLKYTIESPQIIHEWSAGHPDYDPQITDAKIAHWGDTPPSTCFKLGEGNAVGCAGCRHKDKIRSPIVLGHSLPEPAELPEDAPADAPAGFVMADDGIHYSDGDITTKVYGQKFYPLSVAWDHSLGYETVTFRHELPHDGWRDFTIRSSMVQDLKNCLTALHDNHVQVVGKKEKGLMVLYAESYLDKVRNAQRLSQLYSQMGWCKADNDPELKFVLGAKVFSPGREEVAGLAKNIPEIARSITTVGSAHEWAAATQILGGPGMEPLAFALMAGAFGAPLLRFTGFAGALLSMVGATGVGKTLIGYWILSAYGDPAKLVVLRDDTKNMMISRLGLYGTLPLYIDEITNIDAMELSDLVYKITQGRDKGRLTKNAVERGNINQWNTIAVTSTNSSLIDKLGYAKADASAEINRVFEYRVTAAPQLTKEVATGIYRTVTGNYGGIGEMYVKWLVTNTGKHTENIDKLQAHIDKETGASPDERFWSAIAAASIYGGMVAKSLGLIQFEVAPVMKWLIRTIQGMRMTKGDHSIDPISILGRFLDKHSASILYVNETSKKTVTLVRGEHRGAVVARLELDTLKLYISRDELRRDMFRNFGSYDLVRFELSKVKALLKHDIRKNLGAGTMVSGVQQACWEIDLTAPALGHVKMALVNGMATAGGVNAAFA